MPQANRSGLPGGAELQGSLHLWEITAVMDVPVYLMLLIVCVCLSFLPILINGCQAACRPAHPAQPTKIAQESY